MSTAVTVWFVRPETAEGRVAELYQEIRDALGVSWVPDMFQAFATYPRFLEVAWRELRPLIGRAAFETAADDIRRLAHEAIGRFPPTDHVDVLHSRSFAGDFDEIRRALAPFHHADPRLMVMAAVLHDAMQRRPVGTSTAPEASRLVDVPEFRYPIQLVRPERAHGAERRILEEIRQDAELTFVEQEYQALARWPDYLELAYHDFKPYLATVDYDRESLEIRHRAAVAMSELPGPIYADPDTLRGVGIDTDLPRAQRLVDLFHDVLPGLILNVAFFHAGLQRYPNPPTSPAP